MDTISKEKRSWVMSRVKGRDTSPELAVRSLLHRMGYRFRLHRRDLPGNPDIVLPKYKAAIFVHGCFWHRHGECMDGSRMPKSRREYWVKKLNGNKARDERNQHLLREKGWKVLVIWECAIKAKAELENTLRSFLTG